MNSVSVESRPDAPRPEIDRAALERFADVVGPDGAIQVIGTLLGELDARLRDFQRGVSTNDLALARESVHKLKSGTAYVGAAGFAKFCGELEGLARAGAIEPLRAGAGALGARIRQIEQELREYLQNHRPRG